MAGHYCSTLQGKEGVFTKDGKATCFTFYHFLAAARTVRPTITLLDLVHTDDVLSLKLPFENAKGEPFSAIRDVFAKFTVEEWIAVVSTRCQHYFQYFIDMMVLGYTEFKFVFYGKGKYLLPLYMEAFRRAKEFVCANCHNLATRLKAVELETMIVPHFCCIRHPQRPVTMKTMDDGVTFLFVNDESPCTYFQNGNFTHLQFGKGAGQDMLSCLLAILKGNSATDLLATILKSDVDEENPKYSRFDIPDRIVLSSLEMYVRCHGKLILDLVRAKPDDAPTPSTVVDLTVLSSRGFIQIPHVT
jgi:hypothetical protein